MFDIFGFSLTDVPPEHFQKRTHYSLRINRIVVAKDSRDMI